MTIHGELGRTIPDAPGLPEWVLAYAEYDDRSVGLLDMKLTAAACSCGELPPDTHGYSVGTAPGPSASPHPIDCPVGLVASKFWPTATRLYYTDDYAKALAVFERERDKLAGGGEEEA